MRGKMKRKRKRKNREDEGNARELLPVRTAGSRRNFEREDYLELILKVLYQKI